MSTIKSFQRVIWPCLLCTLFSAASIYTTRATAQELDPSQYQALRWRPIGPFRGGRVTSAAGVPGQLTTFYIGTPGGGVWKTTDGGQVWGPIFDGEHIASIGALAVAPSSPQIVYVGTGEQTQGDGVYKSADGGATWSHIGLAETHIITGIVVDPRNPDVVLVAAAGDYLSGAERGIFKSSDGGKNWRKTLFIDNDMGAFDLHMAPGSSRVLYATFWKKPAGPPNPEQPEKPTKQDAAIYRSTDEGSTWSIAGESGLPSEPRGRTGVAVAPGNGGKVVYAIMTQGLFRSEDGGATWQRATTDPRIIGNSYFSRVFVDPGNAATVYVAQTSMYRSLDRGETFDAFAGAPSGDDFHVIWIDPTNRQSMILAVDQGAIISVNGGKTWSSWYNQPTGQFYHVTTDDHYPYYVYAAQQDSGTAATTSRSDYGEITYRDWAPAGGFEYSFMAPDPLNPNYVYVGGWFGTVLRYDKITGQVTHLFVRSAKYRTASMAPIVFSPQDPHTLYLGAQYLMKTTDGGLSWQEASPDLTQKPQPPNSKPEPKGVISTLAVSTMQTGEIWAGTSNGLIQIAKSDTAWQNVTPPNLPEHSAVNAIEASHYDPATAYAVINVFHDLRPLIYRTSDYGKTWQPIAGGLPQNAIARVVREDPTHKGLLYAGTENAVYVSFDDGEHWKSLQLNLPTTPVRDLAVHGSDLVAATYGRALWILDDLAPLRQWDANRVQSEVYLFLPENAVRARWDMNQDTPLPPETPAGKNPPDGAIFDYWLKSPPATAIKLAIYDAQNNLVREYSSVAPPVDPTPANVPSYWFAPPESLPKTAGINRFVWDLRYPAPQTLHYSYYGKHLDYIEYTLADHAIPGDTPRDAPLGPLATPGAYWVELSAGSQRLRQSFTITLDPRVQATQADLQRQLEWEKKISSEMAAAYDGYTQAATLRTAIAGRVKSLGENSQAQPQSQLKDALDHVQALEEQAASLEDGTRTEPGFGPLNLNLARLATMMESGDAKPATSLEEAADESCQRLLQRLSQWRELNGQKIPEVNQLLQRYNQAPLPQAASLAADPSCGK